MSLISQGQCVGHDASLMPFLSGVPRTQKLRSLLVGAQVYISISIYQTFYLPKRGAGPNVALHAAPAYKTPAYLLCLYSRFI